jgi:hypothetical protein
MKRSLVVVTAVALVLAAAYASTRSAAAPAAPARSSSTGMLRLPAAAPAGQETLWGHIKSLRRSGKRFELRFDPALWLTGLAADRAAKQDGREVANDYYVVDESHRQLTYAVFANARVTVLTRGLRAQRISVAELAGIVKGKNPRHRKLFDAHNALGFWIRIGDKYPNPALSIDQQYQP